MTTPKMGTTTKKQSLKNLLEALDWLTILEITICDSGYHLMNCRKVVANSVIPFQINHWYHLTVSVFITVDQNVNKCVSFGI